MGFEGGDLGHWLAAARAAWNAEGFARLSRRSEADDQRHAGVERNPLARGFGRGVGKTIVTSGVHFGREDVAEVAADELGSGKGHGFAAIALSAVLP